MRKEVSLESTAIRHTPCAASVALRPATFRKSQPVANVATLPSARESKR